MSSKVLIKIHNEYLRIISICDKDLFNKEIEHNGLRIKIKEPFYGGEEYDIEKDLEKIKEILQDFDVINAIGKNSIELLKRLGIIRDVHVKYIKDIPHIQVYVI